MGGGRSPGPRPSWLSRFAVRLVETYREDVRSRIHTTCSFRVSCSAYALRMYRDHGFTVASVKTFVRIARCGLVGRRVRRRLVSAGGLVLVVFAFWGGAAAAQVEGPCTITVTTQGQASDVNSHSRPGTALPVRYGQVLRIDSVSTGAITSHAIQLELAGVSWTADEGVDSGNSWGGEVNVSTYAGGYGLHKVTGLSFGPGACSGTAYVDVQGGNPLGGPVGAGAAAATGLGVAGLATVAFRSARAAPGTSEQLGEQIAASVSPEDQGWGGDLVGPDPLRVAEDPIGFLAFIAKMGVGCLAAMVPALLMTVATMAAGAGAPAAPIPHSIRRLPWRPRISLVGLGSGFFTALGMLVLLQQFGVVYPTLAVTVTALLLGVLTGVLVPSLFRIAALRKVNRAIAYAEWRLSQGAVAGGPEGEAVAEWAPTHAVPEGGMMATEAPDPSSEVIATLEPGLPVRVVEWRGDWAQIVAENGWWGWVDGRGLVETSG